MKLKHYQPKGFSTRLYEAFIKSGLTVKEIGRRTGLARSSIYYYLYYGTTPNITTLAKLCLVFGVSADYLLFGKEV